MHRSGLHVFAVTSTIIMAMVVAMWARHLPTVVLLPSISNRQYKTKAKKIYLVAAILDMPYMTASRVFHCLQIGDTDAHDGSS